MEQALAAGANGTGGRRGACRGRHRCGGRKDRGTRLQSPDFFKRSDRPCRNHGVARGCTLYGELSTDWHDALLHTGTLHHVRGRHCACENQTRWFSARAIRRQELRARFTMLLHDPRLNHQPEVVSGVREPECRQLLQEFFVWKRKS